MHLEDLTIEQLQALADDLSHRKRRRQIAKMSHLAKNAEDDFKTFIEWTHPGYKWTKFHETLAEILQWVSDQMLAGRNVRMCVHAPPQHGKTAQISERFGPWHHARAARRGLVHSVVLSSYSDERAERNGGTARAIAREIAPYWPELGKPPRGDDRKGNWQTRNGGRFVAVGRGGPITGEGAHLAIGDDLLKNDEEADSEVIRDKCDRWFKASFMSRVRSHGSGNAVVLLMTRWHEDDQIGRLMKRQPDRWLYVDLPALALDDEVGRPIIPGTGIVGWRAKGEALAPALFDEEALAEKRLDVDERWWWALYQGRPTPADGSLFKRAYFTHRYDHDPQRPPMPYGTVTLVCDANFKKSLGGSNACIQAWGSGGPAGDLFDKLDEVLAESVEYPDLRQAMLDGIVKWQPHVVVVEDKANGSALVADLEASIKLFCQRRRLRRPTFVRYNPGSTTKPERAQTSAYWWKAGKIRLPEAAPWVPGFVEEMVRAAKGALKMDRVDTQSMYILHATSGEDGRDAVRTAKAVAAAWGRLG